MSIPALPDVAGLSLSGGSYTITPQANAEVCQTTGTTPAADGTAHPIFVYIATQLGMRLTVPQLCAACAFNLDDGPMMVGSRADFPAALRVGETYQVTGAIRALTRKTSRKLGIMDLLEYRLELRGADGTIVAATDNSWVLPRRSAA